MTRQLFYATANPGKLAELRTLLAPLSVLGPRDLDLTVEVEESGATLEENAVLKLHAFAAALPSPEFVILADDTGIEIDALNGEPGIHVRRWIGRRMSDAEIIEHCLSQMAQVPTDERGAQFRTVFAMATGDMVAAGTAPVLVDGTLRGSILPAADDLRIEGFPFESLFWVDDWDRLLGSVHHLPAGDRAGFETHRARALVAALPRLRVWLA